jgi:hypothetical protein
MAENFHKKVVKRKITSEQHTYGFEKPVNGYTKIYTPQYFNLPTTKGVTRASKIHLKNFHRSWKSIRGLFMI